MKFRNRESAAAIFSDDERYRYYLMREWDKTLPIFGACMLNPSTADEAILDPTIKQVIKRAMASGCGTLEVVNIFALRSTDPKALYKADNPIGGDANDRAIIEVATRAHILLLGWGTHGKFRDRGLAVRCMLSARNLLHKCRYLKLTKDNQPGHPLYVPDDAPLKEFS